MSPAKVATNGNDHQGRANPVKVYELVLEEDGSPNEQKSYIRLPAPVQPYVLRFSIEAGSTASQQAHLWTNYSSKRNTFERTSFEKTPFSSSASSANRADLLINSAGVFEFYVEYTTDENDQDTANLFERNAQAPKHKRGKSGYFNVDPILQLAVRKPILSAAGKVLSSEQGGGAVTTKNDFLSLDAIVLQTLISKWAGPLSGWSVHLDSARDAGYNMIHFPPLNVRGASNSPYSIGDQHDFSYDLFPKHIQGPKQTAERVKQLKTVLQDMKSKHGILSMSDVVWNHTAHNSEWLNEHPDAAYSPANSPHLQPADELEKALFELNGKLKQYGIPDELKSDIEIAKLIDAIKQHVLGPLKLWQYYVIDIKAAKESFRSAVSSSKAQSGSRAATSATGILLKEAAKKMRSSAVQNEMKLAGRFATTVDVRKAAQIVQSEYGFNDVEESVDFFAKVADEVNASYYAIYDEDVKAILSNLEGRLKFTRIDPNGPQLGKISKESPFFEPYFTRLDPKHPSASGRDPKELSLANNGWIWAANPLEDFASDKSRVYLRRELIVWGDCVKLRYGSGPRDSPYLWKHMEEYTRLLASNFDAFRIDNCHSTPIHVGEHFLDIARQVNPNLYVCAELFTGSAEMDVHFVSRLGINSLIREMENGHDPKEESRLLYRFGVNKPIGSMDGACLTTAAKITLPEASLKDANCLVEQLTGSSPHALFMDVTHDNETPSMKRTTEDAITMGALVAFSWSAIGSTKGFDDLYPKTLDVVQESRLYRPIRNPEDSGIGAIKRLANHLHVEMVRQGYSEGHIHQENDYLVMHRVHPQTHRGFVCLAHTAFHKGSKDRGHAGPFKFDRTKVTYILGKSLEVTSKSAVQDDKYLDGLPSRLIDLAEPEIRTTEQDGRLCCSEIVVPDFFPPGSVMLFATEMDNIDHDIDSRCLSGADEAMKNLDLVDLNAFLYRADGEEKDVTEGNDGVYTIPGCPPLVYCGLEGWMSVLRPIIQSNDLGHPLCGHLRDGTWTLDYVHQRLLKQINVLPRLAEPAQWLSERFDLIKNTAPNFMRPKYFALVIKAAYDAAVRKALSRMAPIVKNGHDFIKALALCSVQMNGVVKSASLWPDKQVASMAAGLPFFAAGWARLWGRDVFISLRGLYLVTGMYDAAREHILGFGSTLKHGMIPNLLDSGKTPRYNCRDGPWFFAQNVQDYTKMVPNGEAILSEKVARRFPLDDEWVPWDDPKAFAHESTVAELIQEILQRHASGIHFREYNAGPAIDQDMHPEGFNIDVDVDWETGIIFGGNEHNCGTWQDKNGSSAKAGNKGLPGSPRNGAAIEITALLKSTLTWVASLEKKGVWKEGKGVEATINGEKTLVTYQQWADLLQKSFERAYYIPLDASDDSSYDLDAKLVNRRGIYKDVYGSSKGREWADYQFRSNFPIAMCVAPELFKPEHACNALNKAREVLVGPLGMKTLDPSDWNYRPNYDQRETDDPSTSCGWNYHNGPEWLWLRGYYLRAVAIFGAKVGVHRSVLNHRINTLMLEQRKHIRASPWAGLPELTNAGGAHCPDSCATQAWSAAALLDTLEEMAK
ncbi:probable 4-alpha-glucanotransferase / amylo-1,6-glucosidase (glycogen-debranching enzyme) [Melanopsichium pennsylvanicum]|uniref:Glycogen debranching enzyme n=2 Tax=Melanopsichium pennsylvanicum TaxID=63383 RepID=A0AAJ5C6F1_9BASI|nr:probable 4-alpha-glucanotransferase/amylo-1,6-glucosidase (glycogen-debranching enzyme) [Melanopsichium pennsylvanicum 4]SNX85785.1 probable 4-alpha-glucanotransferase / amylo-1,6-glucosidase (glycogen-debranching enzyme) [Melanopsichium pennsylvanicum]